MLSAQSKKDRRASRLIQHATIVEYNVKSLSKGQEAKVKRACKAFQAAGTSNLWDFKSFIRLNFIKENEVATEDIILAEKVCSPNPRSLKGKSMQLKSAPAADDLAEILGKLLNINEELILSTAGLLVNSLDFISVIVCSLFCRSVALIKLTN